LAKAAVDALCHINIISRGPSTAIGTLLGLNGNRLGGTNSLAQLAGDASLLTRRISSQSMLSSEARTERSLLEGVVDRDWLRKELAESDHQALYQLGHENLIHCLVGQTWLQIFLCH